MSPQDRAITERHAKTLRELIKRPENKVCADCKRNDPRWASWNIGVFLCIRCSGVHRGMGTHISKVKSVDLDVWTPEQMNSILKWGNKRANSYWEAHLKAGHVPPDHKVESFIRSKYESRRWAREGPPPADPSVLDVESPPRPPTPPSAPAARSATKVASPVRSSAQKPQHHKLPSNAGAPQSTSSITPPGKQSSAPQQSNAKSSVTEDLFSLDFRAPPSTSASSEPKKDVKQDILSLFSAPATKAPAAFSSPWDQPNPQQPSAQATSMMGNNGTGFWGANSGWNASTQANTWGAPTTSQPPTFASNPWAAPSSPPTTTTTTTATTGNDLFGASFSETKPKEDAFANLWK